MADSLGDSSVMTEMDLSEMASGEIGEDRPGGQSAGGEWGEYRGPRESVGTRTHNSAQYTNLQSVIDRTTTMSAGKHVLQQQRQGRHVNRYPVKKEHLVAQILEISEYGEESALEALYRLQQLARQLAQSIYQPGCLVIVYRSLPALFDNNNSMNGVAKASGRSGDGMPEGGIPRHNGTQISGAPPTPSSPPPPPSPGHSPRSIASSNRWQNLSTDKLPRGHR